MASFFYIQKKRNGKVYKINETNKFTLLNMSIDKRNEIVYNLRQLRKQS